MEREGLALTSQPNILEEDGILAVLDLSRDNVDLGADANVQTCTNGLGRG